MWNPFEKLKDLFFGERPSSIFDGLPTLHSKPCKGCGALDYEAWVPDGHWLRGEPLACNKCPNTQVKLPNWMEDK